MNVLRIAKELAKKHAGLTITEAKKIVKLFFDEICEALVRDDRVEIRGLASLSVRRISKRMARNPKTNALVEVDERLKVYCRPSKELLGKINNVNNSKKIAGNGN